MLKRGPLNKLPYTFNGYFLVNDYNDVRLVKQFLDVPNLRRSSPFYIFMHFLPCVGLLTLNSFRCLGEVAVPTEPAKKERNRKTAKY